MDDYAEIDGGNEMSSSEQMVLAAIVILAIIAIIWLIFIYQPKTLVPMYYGPYNSTGAPTVSAWQQTTQGGIPNIINARGPQGQPLGIFDYLGRNMTGYNSVPGNLDFAGYSTTSSSADCGCGCGGAKAAQKSAPIVPAAKPPTTIAGKVVSVLKGNKMPTPAAAPKTPATPAVAAAVSASTTLPTNSNVSKVPPKSAASASPAVKSFFNDPMDIHGQQAWCQGGAVPGGRSDCPNGKPPLGPTGSIMTFGSAPQDALAETSATVNSSRSLNRPYDSTNRELHLAQQQMTTAASQSNAAFSAIAAKAAVTSGTDTNRINAFQDSPVNNVRMPLVGGQLGNFRGFNEVSSMDHRVRTRST